MPRNSLEKVKEASYLATVRRACTEAPFQLVREAGGLLIGTAATKQRHLPYPHQFDRDGRQRPLVHDKDGTVVKVVIATENPIYAILAAFAGDVNVPGQRVHHGKLLTPKPFDFNVVQWSDSKDKQTASVPPCVQEVAQKMPNDQIGCIDVVWESTVHGQFGQLIGEKAIGEYIVQENVHQPSQYATTGSRVRVGSLPVFGYDILQLINQGDVEVTMG